MSIPLPTLSTEQASKVDHWLRSVLWNCKLPHFPNATPETHRLKGRLVLDTGAIKMIQGVREIFEIIDLGDRVSVENPTPQGKLVIIGRHLVRKDIEESLALALN
jgi:G3E family GTPase